MSTKTFCDCCDTEIKTLDDNATYGKTVDFRHGNKNLTLTFSVKTEEGQRIDICLICALRGFYQIDPRPRSA